MMTKENNFEIGICAPKTSSATPGTWACKLSTVERSVYSHQHQALLLKKMWLFFLLRKQKTTRQNLTHNNRWRKRKLKWCTLFFYWNHLVVIKYRITAELPMIPQTLAFHHHLLLCFHHSCCELPASYLLFRTGSCAASNFRASEVSLRLKCL